MMYIIIGASGQVGSAIVKKLLAMKKEVRAIAHNEDKAHQLKELGAQVMVADAYNLSSLKEAVKNGTVLFVITPETGTNHHVIAETQSVLNNYHDAVQGSSISKIVGLSSIGAQLGKGSGNLEMSHMLEHAFDDLPLTRVFVRPAYYFSNWLMNLQQVRDTGILSTFYPVDLSIPMISPQDVGEITADIMIKEETGKIIYELTGSGNYTSADVAQSFARVLGKPVQAQQIPRTEWAMTLSKTGFSESGIDNFIKMTELVVQGKVLPQQENAVSLKGTTTLQSFLDKAVN